MICGCSVRISFEADQHLADPLARHAAQARHRLADAAEFLRCQLPEDLGSRLLAERHQEDRTALESLFVHPGVDSRRLG